MFITTVYLLDVGTAITCAGETDVFAFAGVVPTTRIHTESQFQSLYMTIAKVKAQPVSTLAPNHVLRSSSWETKAALFVHRKFVNLPLPLTSPLHQNLLEDLQWATGVTSTNKNSSTSSTATASVPAIVWDSFHTLILLAPCVLTSSSSENTKKNKSSKSSGNSSGRSVPEWRTSLNEGNPVAYYSGSMRECIEFDYFEDEIFCQSAVDLSHEPADKTGVTSGGAFLSKMKDCGDKLVMICFLTLNAYKTSIQEVAKVAN